MLSHWYWLVLVLLVIGIYVLLCWYYALLRLLLLRPLVTAFHQKKSNIQTVQTFFCIHKRIFEEKYGSAGVETYDRETHI